MSERLERWADKNRRSDRARGDGLTPAERRALWTMRREAREAGSQLTSGGKGGLPPSLVLGVFRRDDWRCKRCGELGDVEKNGGLGVHHRSEHLENPKAEARSRLLKREGRVDTRSNVVALCKRCHDAVHTKDREEYGNAEQRAHPEEH